MPVQTYEMTLELRPGTANDFTYYTKDGEKKYLFGKLFAIRHKKDQWSFQEFRNTTLSKLQFNECFAQGLIWVIGNGDEMGVLDVMAVTASVKERPTTPFTEPKKSYS